MYLGRVGLEFVATKASAEAASVVTTETAALAALTLAAHLVAATEATLETHHGLSVEHLLQVGDIELVADEGTEILAVLVGECLALLLHSLALLVGHALAAFATVVLEHGTLFLLLGGLQLIDLLKDGVVQTDVVDDRRIDYGIEVHSHTLTIRTVATFVLGKGTETHGEADACKKQSLFHKRK